MNGRWRSRYGRRAVFLAGVALPALAALPAMTAVPATAATPAMTAAPAPPATPAMGATPATPEPSATPEPPATPEPSATLEPPAAPASPAPPAPAPAVSAAPPPPGAVPGGDASPGSVAEARRRVYPALVNISMVKRYFEHGHARRASAAGSGVIVSPDGYVLTNYHVASHATRILCRLPSGEEFEAGVVTDDPLTDLSVLKLRLDRRSPPGPLPFAQLGDPAALEPGDQVLAMGNPMMLG
ncbi:MAG TPA: trypsin-like peptidase domain-containing protein, partial [Thermoanaerobaculia bacterium]|nr:trypsin-like peptidase domain-containing protein [Thermoanaerobaculia bacterium]